jgi:photosystem II stability/assembly factor-like uncharacterized protein
VIAVAVVVIAVASFAYLHSTRPTETRSLAQSINPPFATLNSVGYHFVTPSLGWAVENPTPAGGFAVFRTRDGAKHWQKQLVRDSSFIGFGQTSIQFLDQEHGYIVAGGQAEQLIRTSDGGDHWETVALPEGSARVGAIVFSDGSNGWLLVGGQGSRLYATSDAGGTWRRLPDPPPDADGLRFRSPSEAWMGSTAVGAPHVYASTDAGSTWQRLDLPPPPGRSWEGSVPAGIELLPQSGVRVFLPPAQPEMVERGISLTLTSFNQGTAWGYVPRPPGVVAYQDSMHWWAMKGTLLFKSTDAGQTWTMFANGLPDWNYLPHVLDPRHAWAVTAIAGGRRGLALTEDGGLHWSRRTVPSAAQT